MSFGFPPTRPAWESLLHSQPPCRLQVRKATGSGASGAAGRGVFPSLCSQGVWELPAGRRGTSGKLSLRNGIENKLDFATLEGLQTRRGEFSRPSPAPSVGGVYQRWLLAETTGLGPVLGRRWVHQGSRQLHTMNQALA